MRRSTFIRGPATLSLALLSLALACAIMARPAPAGAQEELTYARDVAPILQENCQVCHQPGSIAPMSLMTFEAVKRYAPRIREKVSQRIMPPWHIDRSVGVQEFKNDRGLTDDELETLVAWLDSDMPYGDEADLPPTPDFPDGSEWQFKEHVRQTTGPCREVRPLHAGRQDPGQVVPSLDGDRTDRGAVGQGDRDPSFLAGRAQRRAPHPRLPGPAGGSGRDE